jgi:hypothetical protein
MNNKKTVFAFLLCTVLCAAVFAQNESDFKIHDYETRDTSVARYITKYEGWDTKIVIPAQIGGVPVTGIDDGAFKNMGITSLTLPAGIKYISEGAFADNKLTTVTIPTNVGIEKNAFSNNQLTSLTIGNGCTIWDDAFSNNRLTTLTIGNGCTIYGAPFSTGNLKNIVLGANIDFENGTFGDFLFFEYIFNGKKAGTYDRTVRYTKKKEGDYEFYETKYGTVIVKYTGNESNRLIIPGKLGNAVVKGIYGEKGYSMNSQEIIIGAFMEKDISRMQLPDSLIYIGERAFFFNKLTSVTIPNTVTYIGDYAFSNRDGYVGNELTSVTIPNGVTYIGNEAFSRTGLTSGVTFEGADTRLHNKTFDGDLYSKYHAGGSGTYIVTEKDDRFGYYPKTWTKQ